MTVLDPERARWRDAAWSAIDPSLLRDLVVAAVDTPSPTGEEAALARLLADALSGLGLSGRVQPIDEAQSNAVGALGDGRGGGADLMLYAPLDTLHVGEPGLDEPWTGAGVARPDLLAQAVVDGDLVTGLGAGNPKGHAVCCVAAAAAVAAARVPLSGRLLVGLGAGGMPTNPVRPGGRRNTGQGVGASFLLEQGAYPDAAVIAKPGWSVSWEEVGLAWFEIRVRGTHTYVGSRHRLPYRNAIREAAAVVEYLEDWFPQYTRRHTDGLVAPQGVIASISGGDPRTAALTPAEVVLRADLRLSPRTSPQEAAAQLGSALNGLRERSGVDVDWAPVLSIPGSATDPSSFVVRAAISAWEQVAGSPHVAVRDTSGATDANILRNRGVPTARVGMPKVADLAIPGDFALGMNVVDLHEMERLTRLLVQVVVDTCTRPREEVVRL